FEFRYQDADTVDFRNHGGSATVGIRSDSFVEGAGVLQYSFDSPAISSGQAIHWTSAANQPPTGLALSSATVPENSPAGPVVGTVSTADPDAGDTFTYTLLDSAGGRFRVADNQLLVDGPLDFEAAPGLTIRVRTTDAGGLSFDQSFPVAVTDV